MPRFPRAVVALLVAAAACAQERRTMPGLVLGADGEPVAGAVVHFLLPSPLLDGERLLDAATATTDDRGRFRARLRSGALYIAWATAKDIRSQARHASPTSWVHAASVPTLRLGEDPPPAQLRLDGVEAWRGHGPLVVRWFVGGAPVPGTPAAVDDEGSVALPALPAGRTRGALFDSRGPIARLAIAPGSRGSTEIAPPQRLPMRALDSKGRPVAGVEIRQWIAVSCPERDPFAPNDTTIGIWRELGTTDVDGRLVATISAHTPPLATSGWQDLKFFASKEGFASSISGLRDELYRNGQEIDREGIDELPFLMDAAHPIHGRIRHGSRGVPNAQAVAVWRSRTRLKETGGIVYERFRRAVTTDEEGRFVITDLPPNAEDLELLVPTYALHSLASPFARELDLDLDATERVEVRLLDTEGGPANEARVALLSHAQEELQYDERTPFAVVDGAGRLTMHLQPGKWVLLARDTTGMVARELVAKPGGETTLLMRLEPIPALRCRVVDENGDPVSGAHLEFRSTAQSLWDDAALLEPIATEINGRWLPAATRPTDEKGLTTLRFLDFPNLQTRMFFQLGTRQTPPFSLQPSEETLTLRLR